MQRHNQLKTTLRHKWYSSELTVGGWAVATFYGPFHRYRATKAVEDCKLKAAIILVREMAIDKTNLVEI
jgi:hypothetical protein